jgi:hypothetical protein
MSLKTTNYEFVKPELTDPADITAMNGNWDKIDTMFKGQLDDIGTIKSNHTTLSNTVTNNKTELNNKINTEVGKLQKKITYGTAAPSGGSNGDVYIQLI